MRGRDLLREDWLPYMSPARLTPQIQFLPKGKKEGMRVPSFSVGWSWMWLQRQVPDIPDFALPPGGFALLSASAFWLLTVQGVPLEVGLSGENLLNTRYREYFNRFRYFADEPGHNVMLRLKWSFGQSEL